MSRSLTVSLTLLTALALCACSHNDSNKASPAESASAHAESAPTPVASEAPPAEPTPTPPAQPDIDDNLLSTEEDFEDEASKDISSSNMESELDRLEKEINAPPAAPAARHPATQ